MYDFRDYHRTIVTYHGTTVSEADRLVDGQAFTPSNKSTEWLGQGVYFWEYAPKQAWWWAKEVRKHTEPAVVGAMVRLGNCLDLLDPANVQWLRRYYDDLLPKWTVGRDPIPRNVLSNKGYGLCDTQLGLLRVRHNGEEDRNKPRRLRSHEQVQACLAGELDL
jgi:hypothetical protein